MIEQIDLTKQYLSLCPCSWKNVPKLAVITGVNGSGKTQLLKLLAEAITTRNPHLGIKFNENSEKFRSQKIYSVFTGYDFGSSDRNNRKKENLHDLSRQRNLKFVRQLREKITNPLTPLPVGLEQVFEEVSKNEDISKVPDETLFSYIPHDLVLKDQAFFDNAFIVEVFTNYLNKMNQIKLETYDEQKRFSDDEIFNKLGAEPPWKTINDSFEKYDFNYQINTPTSGLEYEPMFVDKLDGNQVPFTGLSTGEQVIVTLILWAFNAHLSAFADIFIFDEIDAHLNPSLSKMLMEIVNDHFIEQFGMQVFMSTHSPSTVAYTNPNSLFWLDRGLPIEKATHEKVIPILSDGIITISESKALQIFSSTFSDSDLPIVCVEGKTDKMILETAWQKLFPSETIPFGIQDVFDCHVLTNLFKRGNVFNNYKNQLFIGIVDFDDAYLDLVRKLKKQTEWSRLDCKQTGRVSYKHKNQRGFISTLPIPEFRRQYAGSDLENPKLSIELLFQDQIIDGYCESINMAGGGELLKVKNEKKSKFADSVGKIEAKYFEEFKPLFQSILDYIEEVKS